MIQFIRNAITFDTRFVCDGCGVDAVVVSKKTLDPPKDWIEQFDAGDRRDTTPAIFCGQACARDPLKARATAYSRRLEATT